MCEVLWSGGAIFMRLNTALGHPLNQDGACCKDGGSSARGSGGYYSIELGQKFCGPVTEPTGSSAPKP